MAQQQAIHKFVLGSKEFDEKVSEFQYDKGWYSIVDVVGEERETIYRSKNAQEAYMKWNVYIGRKKERPVYDERRKGDNAEKNVQENGQAQEKKERRENGGQRENRSRRRHREYTR